jgi:hypothetical protein
MEIWLYDASALKYFKVLDFTVDANGLLTGNVGVTGATVASAAGDYVFKFGSRGLNDVLVIAKR